MKAQTLKAALAEAFTHPSYWLLTIGFFVCGFHVNFIVVHLPAFAMDKGLRVVRQKNCAACHQLEPGQIAFKDDTGTERSVHGQLVTFDEDKLPPPMSGFADYVAKYEADVGELDEVIVRLLGNEDAVAFGRLALEAWEAIEKKLLTDLARAGIAITRSYTCIDHPEGIAGRRNDSVYLLPNTGAFYHALHADGIAVIYDVTHSLQLPSAAGDETGGDRRFAAPLARAAVAAGADGVFLEVHPRPEEALSDRATQLSPAQARPLLESLLRVRAALPFEEGR